MAFTSSKVTAILLNGWILPIGGASAVKSLRLQQACFYISSLTFNCVFLLVCLILSNPDTLNFYIKPKLLF